MAQAKPKPKPNHHSGLRLRLNVSQAWAIESQAQAMALSLSQAHTSLSQPQRKTKKQWQNWPRNVTMVETKWNYNSILRSSALHTLNFCITVRWGLGLPSFQPSRNKHQHSAAKWILLWWWNSLAWSSVISAIGELIRRGSEYVSMCSWDCCSALVPDFLRNQWYRCIGPRYTSSRLEIQMSMGDT